MACAAFSPQTGVFTSALQWANAASGQFKFTVTNDPAASINRFTLWRGSDAIAAAEMPNTMVGLWAWLPGGKFAALRGIMSDGVTCTARLFVFKLSTSLSEPPTEVIGPFTSTARSALLHLHASPDSTLVLVYMIDSGSGNSGPHWINRTDNWTSVLDWGPVQSFEFRSAEVTPDGRLRFFTSPVPQPGAGTGSDIVVERLNASSVAITSGIFNAEGNDLAGEVITIENCTTVAVPMTRWTLRDRDSHLYTFPAFTLDGKATIKVWTKKGPDSKTDLFMNFQNPVWTNTGDTAILKDQFGNEMSRLVFPGGPPDKDGNPTNGPIGLFPPLRRRKMPPLISSINVIVPESTSGVDTGLDLQAGDWLEIHASGKISTGVIMNTCGPAGWEEASKDPKFPLHIGGNAHPFSLIAFTRTGGRNSKPFYVGEVFWDKAPSTGRLYLRTNDDNPGNGSGQFVANVGLRRNVLLPDPRIESTVTVPESENRVDTGVDVADGEFLEINASGKIWAGVWFAGENDPDGVEVSHDRKYPLNTGDWARPYSLIAFFENNGNESKPFFVGRYYGPVRQRPPFVGRLFLRTNDDTPGGGSGAFSATIKVRPSA